MTYLQPYLAIVASGGLLGLLFILLTQLLKQRRRSWQDIVGDLQQLNTEKLSTVAIDYLVPNSGQIDLEPEAIWESLGGYRGLQKMRENADVMLALAACAQQWNFTEAVIVTERMRMDARSTAPRRSRRGTGIVFLLSIASLPAYPPPPRPGGLLCVLSDAPAPPVSLSDQPRGPLSQAGRSALES